VGILFLDFQFSTAHPFFCFRSVWKANQAVVVGAVEMWESRRPCEISKAAWKWWEARRSLSTISTRRHFHNARYIFRADLHHFPFGNPFAQ
jgi:hypothetical protein